MPRKDYKTKMELLQENQDLKQLLESLKKQQMEILTQDKLLCQQVSDLRKENDEFKSKSTKAEVSDWSILISGKGLDNKSNTDIKGITVHEGLRQMEFAAIGLREHIRTF